MRLKNRKFIMTTPSNESADFDLVPPDQAWMFANSRLTPEQLDSANRVREHAIEGEERVRQRTLPSPE